MSFGASRGLPIRVAKARLRSARLVHVGMHHSRRIRSFVDYGAFLLEVVVLKSSRHGFLDYLIASLAFNNLTER